MAEQPSRHGFRLIAPRTGTEPPATSRSPEDARTKRASAACGECKHRRTKCVVDEAGGPCSECAFHNRECIIDEMADKRRKIAAKETEETLKRTQIELAGSQKESMYWHTYYHYLISAFRFCDMADVQHLIGLTRGGSSDDEIHLFCSRFAAIFPHLDLPIGPHPMNGQDGTLSRRDSQQ
ncbi:hypothetical protein BJX70DRAFT_16712 [Aspergillus crustosus]